MTSIPVLRCIGFYYPPLGNICNFCVDTEGIDDFFIPWTGCFKFAMKYTNTLKKKSSEGL